MIEEKAGTPNKFIVLRQEVLEDKSLNIYEKLVYARIATFETYFESAEACAELLGISKSHVEKAKRSLEKAGYIKCVENTGRGKQYQVVYDLPKWKGRCSKMKDIDIEREVKSINNNDTGVSLLGETPEEHGNENINKMFDEWEAVFGFKQKQSAENRRACYNLIRRKDLGEEKLAKLIRVLCEAQSDRYAPKEVRQIVGFASLQYNLPHLMMWARRRYSQAQTQEGIEL